MKVISDQHCFKASTSYSTLIGLLCQLTTSSLTLGVHHQVQGLLPWQSLTTLLVQLLSAVSPTEEQNMARSNSVSPTSHRMQLKFHQTWEMKIWICFSLSGVSSRHLNQFTCWQLLTVFKTYFFGSNGTTEPIIRANHQLKLKCNRTRNSHGQQKPRQPLRDSRHTRGALKCLRGDCPWCTKCIFEMDCWTIHSTSSL